MVMLNEEVQAEQIEQAYKGALKTIEACLWMNWLKKVGDIRFGPNERGRKERKNPILRIFTRLGNESDGERMLEKIRGATLKNLKRLTKLCESIPEPKKEYFWVQECSSRASGKCESCSGETIFESVEKSEPRCEAMNILSCAENPPSPEEIEEFLEGRDFEDFVGDEEKGEDYKW